MTLLTMDNRSHCRLTGAMCKGALAGMRNMRRWFVHAVALALMLPAIIGLLPQQALSASAAFDRDFLVSVCGHDLPGQRTDGGQHQGGDDHCVLCAGHGFSCSPGIASVAPVSTAAPPGSLPQPATASALAPPLQALLDARPPRGPPVLD